MESTIYQAGKSAYVIIGPEGATNFSIVKGGGGAAVLIDVDIRRIDEVEEALKLTGCSEVKYLINTHEHFDHTSGNFYFRERGIPIVASAGCVRAMHGNLEEIKSGRKSRDEVAKHMLSGSYAGLGKTRMIERNINQFLTGRWF